LLMQLQSRQSTAWSSGITDLFRIDFIWPSLHLVESARGPFLRSERQSRSSYIQGK
jgi:hypothetical protein